MKLIGITGSRGKTSTAEMVYQYCLKARIRASLYSSNGLFVNGETRQKDLKKTSLSKNEVMTYLKKDKDVNVEIAIIEITAESTLYKFDLEKLDYELVVLTNYEPENALNFESDTQYLNAINKIILNQKNVLIKNDERIKKLFEKINYKTFGYNNDADYSIDLVSNNMKGLRFRYKSREYHTNLITEIHLANLACCLSILESLNIYRHDKFKKFLKKIILRGRVQVFKKRKRTIIVDNANQELKYLIDSIVKTTDSYNYKVFYLIPSELSINFRPEIMLENGKELQKSKISYISNEETKNDDTKVILTKKILNNNYTSFIHMKEPIELFKKALRDLKKNELLIILSRKKYRLYKQYMENKNGKL